MISVIFIICVLFSCINNKVIIEGCRKGLLVWYDSALPVILPFLLLTSLYTSYLSLKNISQKRSILTMLITGLFCGFPTGALTDRQKNSVCPYAPVQQHKSHVFIWIHISHYKSSGNKPAPHAYMSVCAGVVVLSRIPGAPSDT